MLTPQPRPPDNVQPSDIKNNNFLSYLANGIAGIATATTIMSLTAVNSGAQEIARLQEQIKSTKEQLTSIQAMLQDRRSEEYTRAEALRDFNLQTQSIQRVEGKLESEIESLRQRVNK